MSMEQSLIGIYRLCYNQTGFKNPNWKGGRTKIYGYWFVRINGKYIREHVYFYEQKNKLCMLSWGDVHHIDGNKENNMPWNLRGMTKGQHQTLHHIKNMSDRWCSKCGSNKTFMRKTKMGMRPLWKTDGKGNWLCNICDSKLRYRNKKLIITNFVK